MIIYLLAVGVLVSMFLSMCALIVAVCVAVEP